MPPIVALRELCSEMAALMQAMYTFKEIADKFYAAGVIPSPESPYPSYDGNKRDYVLEKLHAANDLETYLRHTVPEVIVDADLEGGPSTSRAEFLLQRLGYTQDPDDVGVQHGVPYYTAPERLPVSSLVAAPARPTTRRIELSDLPGVVQELVDELEDCLARENWNAAALLTRKIIHQAVFVAMRRRGKADELRSATGDDLELNAALGRCAREYGLSSQVLSRVTSAKWIGDSANHSYRVRVTPADLETAVTGVRLFLQEVLSDNA